MKLGSLFSGYGGLDMGVEAVFNTRTVWTSDTGDGPARVLAYRYPHAPNLGDITAVDWASVGLDASGAVTRLAPWGEYAAAIRRWEHTFGRPAPTATEQVNGQRPRLSARFVEWMMGLPDGWVTGVPGLTRSQQLTMLGNGVVPQQAEYALTGLCQWAGEGGGVR